MSAAVLPTYATPLFADTMADTLLQVTRDSTHSYEIALNQLLADLNDMRAHGSLGTSEHQIILGAAVDVLFYFNYSIELLVAETNVWYRASVIHQMAVAMLQAMALLRPDLSGGDFFSEARSMLCYDPPHASRKAPVQCHHWPVNV